jgi:hypothetical protein
MTNLLNIMKYFKKNNCIKLPKQNKKTKDIFTKFYFQIYEGVEYIRNLKLQYGDNFYNLQINQINNINEIPKPKSFPPNSFVSNIRNYIDNNMLYYLTYDINILERKFKIYFITEENITNNIINTYNTYFEWLLVWLYIANKYSNNTKCASNLTIYIYHTLLLKQLPTSKIEVLGQNNVNTAFTRSCTPNSEIVIFRKEEWFKVLIHETFHSFGLDFSDMDNINLHNKILNIFPVKSDVELYEAYTEFWARIINILFCSYIYNVNKNDINQFIKNTEIFINIEIQYSYFQMVKILSFMDLNYTNLYELTDNAQYMRNNLYKEDTSVLSYYIITTILLNNYQEFILWCDTNNFNLLQFNKNVRTQNKLYEFIQKKHKTKRMLDNVKCTTNLLRNYSKLYNSNNINKTNKKELNYLLSNLRMSLCEL